MHQLIKITPLLLGVASLSACSALGLGSSKPVKHTAHSTSGTYTQTASNVHTSTASDYNVDSGWYASTSNPYAGGSVQIDTPVVHDSYTQTSHNDYQDSYANPGAGPVDTTYVTPSLRGSFGPSYYGNLGGIMYDIDDEVFGVIGRLGVQKDWYGAEVEGSFGIIDEELTPTTDATVDSAIAAFAVGRVPLNDKIKALGRLGYHSTKVGIMTDLGNRTLSASDSFDGVAYGAGLEYDINDVNGVRLDYTRYNLADDITSDSLAATYLRRF